MKSNPPDPLCDVYIPLGIMAAVAATVLYGLVTIIPDQVDKHIRENKISKLVRDQTTERGEFVASCLRAVKDPAKEDRTRCSAEWKELKEELDFEEGISRCAVAKARGQFTDSALASAEVRCRTEAINRMPG